MIFEQARCLRGIHIASRCEKCTQICPASAIELLPRETKFDPLKCVKCGACANVCPNDAFVGKNLDALLLSQENEIFFTCEQNEANVGVKLPCLAALDISFLLYAVSLKKSLKIILPNCDSCPNFCVKNVIDETLKNVKEVLAELNLGDKFEITYTKDANFKKIQENIAQKQTFARRRFFLKMLGKSPDSKSSEQENASNFSDEKFKKNERFLKALQILCKDGEIPPLKIGRKPVIRGVCAQCSICARVCPSSALSFKEEKFSLRLDETACTGCELCADVCFAGAIEFIDKRLDELSKTKLLYRSQNLVTRDENRVPIYFT